MADRSNQILHAVGDPIVDENKSASGV
jgi:hypothetical protein